MMGVYKLLYHRSISQFMPQFILIAKSPCGMLDLWKEWSCSLVRLVSSEPRGGLFPLCHAWVLSLTVTVTVPCLWCSCIFTHMHNRTIPTQLPRLPWGLHTFEMQSRPIPLWSPPPPAFKQDMFYLPIILPSSSDVHKFIWISLG